jgi:hypothetical protein
MAIPRVQSFSSLSSGASPVMDWLQSAQIRCNSPLPHAFAPHPEQVYLTRLPDFFGLVEVSRIAASAHDKANPVFLLGLELQLLWAENRP